MNWLERLNQIKKASGNTNEEIANMSGIPKSTVDKLFSGQTKNPAYTTVQAIVNCLGYPVDAISEPYANKKAAPEEIESDINNMFDALYNQYGEIPKGKLDLIVKLAKAVLESDI